MTTSHIMSYSKTTTDVRVDSTSSARNIGTLIDNTSRLTIRSSLLSKDKTDYFSFTVKKSMSDVGVLVKATGKDTTTGKEETLSSLNVKGDTGYARLQVLDSRGRVVADSSTTATSLQQQAYEDMRNGKLSLSAGTYFVKMSRASGVMDTQKVGYAVQLVAGKDYTKNYDTVEYAYSLDNDSELNSTTSDIANMLSTSAPDGTEMTNIVDTLSSNYTNFLV